MSTKVGFEVPIHDNSVKYINRVLGEYKEIPKEGFITDPIIHMYAKEDTRDLKTGELNGYVDSLFCEYHFYNPRDGTVFKSSHHDSIFFGEGVNVSNIKIFKDGSTLIQLYGEYLVLFGTAVHIAKRVGQEYMKR